MYGFSLVWLLVLILFRAILVQSIEFRLECLLLKFILYTIGKFIVICKPPDFERR